MYVLTISPMLTALELIGMIRVSRHYESELWLFMFTKSMVYHLPSSVDSFLIVTCPDFHTSQLNRCTGRTRISQLVPNSTKFSQTIVESGIVIGIPFANLHFHLMPTSLQQIHNPICSDS